MPDANREVATLPPASELEATLVDAVVIGGGPGGSATATHLARLGRRVALLEKDRHPRFHIGESLLPMSMPLLQQLGVLDAVVQKGIVKRGADFPTEAEPGFLVFDFRRSLNPTWPHAVQVRRAEFDQILFDCARSAGVKTFQETLAKSVTWTSDGVEVDAVGKSGEPVRIRARYLIDASGRETLLARQLQLKERSRVHQSAALYAHFTGITRRAGEHAGNISIYRVDDGWIWLIPLPDDVVSVGLVCGPDTLRRRGTDQGAFLLATLQALPALAERLIAPRMVGEVTATGNYSYSSREVAGRRWIMVGDAGVFVDPIFSTGVHLALHGAARAADLVHRVLDDPGKEAQLQRAYSREQRAAVRRVSWFIVRFNTPVMRHLFANPRNVMRIEEAMISMLAGDLYRDGGITWRLAAFKMIYWIHCLFNVRSAFAGMDMIARRRREQYLKAPPADPA